MVRGLDQWDQELKPKINHVQLIGELNFHLKILKILAGWLQDLSIPMGRRMLSGNFAIAILAV